MDPEKVQHWVFKAMDRFKRQGDAIAGSAIDSVSVVSSDHGQFVALRMIDGDEFELQVMRNATGRVDVQLTPEQVDALATWAREADKPKGCSGWGPAFDAAMDVARAVNSRLSRD